MNTDLPPDKSRRSSPWQEWAARHDIQGSDTDLKAMFDDARTAAPSSIAAHDPFEYDGAFKCKKCGATWGALPGNPRMPERCLGTTTGETPRTDAVSRKQRGLLCSDANLEFARQLERENNALRAEIEQLQSRLRRELEDEREASASSTQSPPDVPAYVTKEWLTKQREILRGVWYDDDEQKSLQATDHIITLALEGLASRSERGERDSYKEAIASNLRLRKALEQSVRVTREWHAMPNKPGPQDDFDIYFNHSPEMKLIREALGKMPDLFDEPAERKRSDE